MKLTRRGFFGGLAAAVSAPFANSEIASRLGRVWWSKPSAELDGLIYNVTPTETPLMAKISQAGPPPKWATDWTRDTLTRMRDSYEDRPFYEGPLVEIWEKKA